MNMQSSMSRCRPNAQSIVRGVVSKVLLGLTLVSLAYSAQPPPPTEYTLTVNRSGGGECTTFHINTPVGSWNTPTSEEFEVTFVAGTFIEVEAEVDCPCGYQADHWLVNDEEIDEGGSRTLAGIDLYEDTTATAVFSARTGTLTIYVDDPSSDSSPHSWLGDTGHTFWKFEGACVPEEYEDIVGVCWGFWPVDETPYEYSYGYKIWVDCAGDVYNDDDHEYNRTPKTYSIDYDDLIAGLQFTAELRANPPNYRVEEFNCTDAAISAADAAGVTLPNAEGSCNHLTHSFNGSCPGTLGENLNE